MGLDMLTKLLRYQGRTFTDVLKYSKSFLFNTVTDLQRQSLYVTICSYIMEAGRRISASCVANSSLPPSACEGTFRCTAPRHHTGASSVRHGLPPTSACAVTHRSISASAGARRNPTAVRSAGRLCRQSRVWNIT